MSLFSNYWLVWAIGVPLWILLGIVEFCCFEIPALRSSDPNKPTLSRFVYTLNTKFPLFLAYSMLILGIVIGTLCTHFDWHWCPPGSTSAG